MKTKTKMMKLTIFLIVLFFISVSCAKTKDQISLNGTWQFVASNEIGAENVLTDENISWDTLSVPGNWDTQEKYSEYVGTGYYKRTFEVPKAWNGSRLRLKFDAVYETSKVWLNGQLLGEHVGGYTPFEFNITETVNYQEANTLVVMADNTFKRGAWWAWGGISRDVSLVRNNDVRMVYQHITAVPDFEKKIIQFSIKYRLENNSSVKKTFKMEAYIKSLEATLFSHSVENEIEANSFTSTQITFTEPLAKYNLWHFNQPNLYQLQSELFLNEKSIDLKTDNFGIRKLEAKGEQLFLNNEVVYMNGFNRVHDHPDYGNTEPNKLVRNDIQDIKALGGVFSRMMHAPQAVNLLDFCDSIGYMLIEEIPVWGDDDPHSFPNNQQAKQWMKELIERDFNHPCVVGWSVGNELRDTAEVWADKVLTEDQFNYINSMLDYIDELDTTRLKTYVSLTSYLKNASLNNEPFEKLDLLCINSYGDGVKAAQNTHAKFSGKPIFISEIGIAQIGPAPDGELSEKLINQLKGLKELSFVVGSSLWSYNDYRSNYKGTPASGFREWGVVDEYRKPKKAYFQINEIYSGK